MPIRLETPVLSVDVEKLRELDTRNAEHLFGLYSMFSKCAESMEDGRRLENLTWRLWNRETLCCEPQPQHNHTTTPTIDFARSRPSRRDVPGLSASVESFVSIRSDSSEDTQQAPTAPLYIHANASPKHESMISRSRGKEKHITSLGLEKMVHSIQDKQEIAPLSPSIADAMPPMPPSTTTTPRAASPIIHAPFRSSDSSSSTAPLSSPESDKSAQQTVGSDTSAEMLTSHSVIRGFSRGQESSYRSHTHLAPEAIPMKYSSTDKTENPSKKVPIFLVGAYSSGDDDDSSFDDKMISQSKQSSLTLGLKRPSGSKKTLSFRDEVESRALEKRSHEDEEVFESDEEDESAIDDDSEEEDDDDWEDDASENAEITANDKPLFQRVDSQTNIVSRRSVLTTELHQLDRAATFANLASKSSPVIRRTKTSTFSGASDGVSPVEDPSLTVLPGHMTRSKPMVMTARTAQQMAFSPKTTRRNMLATEMTESLRKNVLWERQQKKATTNAIIKRRHTAQNLTTLHHYPGEAVQASKQGSRNTSFDHYFEAGLGEYHRAGW
ncbi:MAG: hypothetical protein ASARMPREDX12_001549 [Alectoria sarmentosa]|nr:MAG: hypothetical protein ASARMPREDX12_001549 [Alectoria sarmentosa]